MTNGTMIQYFHWHTPGGGILWKELKENAQKLAGMGITAVWLPPVSKGSSGAFSVGYDIYDLYDLGEFDQKGSIPTKYGTKEQLIEAVQAIHDAGMQVIVDIVLNHLGGADETEKVMAIKVNPENRNEFISEPYEIEAYTKFTYPGRKGKYSEFVWTHQCFTGVDYDHKNGETAIFNLLNEWGNDWEEMVDEEKGNFDYLMYSDIEFRNTSVREELGRWGKWLHDTLHFDGVRLDAVKHITPKFFNEWLHNLRSETGKEIFAVGEFWAAGQLDLLLLFLEKSQENMSLFDSPLHNKLHRASNEGNNFDMTTIFHDTLVNIRPDKAVTVVENHDTQPLQASEAPVEPWFKPIAYALILLRKDGYPCIFYPDLYGSIYTDSDDAGNEYEIFMNIVPELEPMIKARKNYAYGNQRDYLDHANCIGWTREGDDDHSGCAVILSNGDKGFKTMEMGGRYEGKIFVDMLKNYPSEITLDKEGKGEFLCEAGKVSVWIEKS